MHIRFYAQDGSALMEVQDDGKGGAAPFGHGLTGMRERIQSLGGALQLDTARRTRLMITLPAELHRTRKGQRPRVIILTTFARPGYLRRALDAGASGYLLKDAPAEKLADAIRGVHQGLRVRSPIASARCCAPRKRVWPVPISRNS